MEKLVEKEDLKDKGTYHYDEQFPSINKESQSRLMIMDSKTKYPYNDFLEIATLFGVETIEKYFHEILDNIPHEIMVTDGYNAYPAIIEKFNMIQQRCVFHMMYNVGTEIYPVILRFTRKNKGKNTHISNNTNMKKSKDSSTIHILQGTNTLIQSNTFHIPQITTKISINKIKQTYKDTIIITGKLTDNKGTTLKNTKIKIKINTKTYTTRTNTKGIYTLKTVANKVGTNTITATYQGNKNYKTSTAKTTFKVK